MFFLHKKKVYSGFKEGFNLSNGKNGMNIPSEEASSLMYSGGSVFLTSST